MESEKGQPGDLLLIEDDADDVELAIRGLKKHKLDKFCREKRQNLS